MKPSKLLLIGYFSIALLSGCTQWHYHLGQPLSPEALPDPAQTATLAEILSGLGPPQRISAIGNGYILAWEFWQISEETVGLSLGLVGTNLLSIDWGQARIKGEFLLITFNRQHLVTSTAFANWDNNGGSGGAIQPPLGLFSVVDVDDLTNQMPHHQWGGSLLSPLPQAINSNSRPDTGQTGIQQRGTPNGSGQQSLEIDIR